MESIKEIKDYIIVKGIDKSGDYTDWQDESTFKNLDDKLYLDFDVQNELNKIQSTILSLEGMRYGGECILLQGKIGHDLLRESMQSLNKIRRHLGLEVYEGGKE